MTRLLARSLLALFLSLVGLYGSTISEAMPQTWKDSFIQNLMDIHARQPPYVMDARIKPNDPIEKGVDCSRLLYLAARRSGFLVSRVTAADIADGAGGWTGYSLSDKLRDSDEADLAFWIWTPSPGRPKSKRPQHTGAFVVGPNSGLLEVLHASSSRRTTVIQPLHGVLNRDLTKVRRLTIGEAK